MVRLSDVEKVVFRATRSIRTTVLRAVVSLTKDSTKMQSLQLKTLAARPHDDVEHFQGQGVSFLPPKGSEAVALAVGGDAAHLVALAAGDRRKRPTDLTDEGTGGLHYLGEWKVFLDSSGVVHIGEKAGAQPIARADDVKAQLDKIQTDIQKIHDMFSNWTPVPNDGGAALKTQFTNNVAGQVPQAYESVAAEKGRVT